MEKANKIQAYKFGLFSETITCFFLRIKGYKILERRYKTNLGEVDIIAKKSGVIIFIEVKARKNGETDVLAQHQMKRIIKSGELFIAKHRQFASFDLRFDLIIIRPFKLPEHIINAWQC